MEFWLFWAVMAVMTAGILVTFWRAITQSGAARTGADSIDVTVYRDQLREIDRDLERGAITQEEAQRLRVEISRRLLDADRAAKTDAQSKSGGASLAIGMAVVALALVGSIGVYMRLGAPGYPDLPLERRLALADEAYAARPTQDAAEAAAPKAAPPQGLSPEFLDLMEKLRQAVKASPNDIRGLELLARNEATLGNLADARRAQEQLITLKGQQATAADYASLAELMVMAAGGTVTPQAEQMLIKALQLDPTEGSARYYTGLMFAQVGRFDRAFVMWNKLLEQSPANAPWTQALRADLPEIASRAGEMRFELPPETAGPSAADVAAAAQMSGEDRRAMVEGMVAQLSARLASEGGSAEEWARLITSLGVLDRKDEARQIYTEAQERFKGQSVELQGLREAAASAGVAE